MAEPNDLHRYGLRLWRQAHGATLSRTRARVCSGVPNLLRTGETVSAGGGPSARADGATDIRRRARHRRRDWQTNHLDSTASHSNHSRRKQYRGVGSNESLCGKPEMVDLSAAHDVAIRDESTTGF